MKKVMDKAIRVSNKIFDSYASVGIAEIVEDEKWQRSYEIWEHACKLIDRSQDDFSLSDGMANLKRALNHRLQLIEELYHFKEINFSGKPKGYLELLETYAIVRPYIMKKLLKIRNEIEHKDQNPPKKDRCNEFVDIIWYFLKSTDSMVQSIKHHVDFNIRDEDGDNTVFRFVIEIDWKKHYNLKIHGYFPKEYISELEKEDYILIYKIDHEELYTIIDEKSVRISGGCTLATDDYHLLLKEILMYAR